MGKVEEWGGVGSVSFGTAPPLILCCVMLAMLWRESALWRRDTYGRRLDTNGMHTHTQTDRQTYIQLHIHINTHR